MRATPGFRLGVLKMLERCVHEFYLRIHNVMGIEGRQ